MEEKEDSERTSVEKVVVADPFGTLTPGSQSPPCILLLTLHYFTLPYLA